MLNSRWLITILLAVCCALSASGATLSVPADYPSIQEALDAAQTGDTVLIAPGTYSERLEIGTAVTLASEFLTTGDPSFVATTIIDGGGSGIVIELPPTAELGTSIVGLTIQNGRDGIWPEVPLTLTDSVIRGNGDGIDFKNGSGGVVRNCVFEDNSDDGVDLNRAVALLFEDSVVRNNGDDGIEIRLQNYVGPTLQVVFRRNQIHGNDRDGIQLIDYDSPSVSDRFFEFSHNAIYDNGAAGIGMMGNAKSLETFEAADLEEPVFVLGNTFSGNDHGISGGDNTLVLNNLFVGHTTLGIKQVDGLSEVAFNLFFGNTLDDSGSNQDPLTNRFADPLLAADLRLQAGSPGIDAGTASYVFQGVTALALDPTQYAGLAPDVGAFEFGSLEIDPPAVPTLAAPPDGSVDLPLMPTLSWSGAADVFALEIATDASFASLVHTATLAGSATSYSIGPGVLENATSYRWRVRGANAGGTSAWSVDFGFVTEAAGTPPDAPVTLLPVAGATRVSLTPLLRWAGTAQSFEVEVADSPAFDNVVFQASTAQKSLLVAPGALAYETPYTWRVAGTNAFGTGAASTPSSFTTRVPPDTTPPTVPQNLTSPDQTETTIDLIWDESTDDRELAGYNVFRDGVFSGSESEPSHELDNLVAGTLYDFEVSAFDESGNESARSDVLTVATQLFSPPLPFAVKVVDADDDAEERPIGSAVKLGSSDLELVTDGSNDQLVGLRFQDLPLPAGAILQHARIRFTVDEESLDAADLLVEGEAADSAAPFGSARGELSSRPRTLSSVSWVPAPWPAVGESGPDQETPDLAGVLQEIVDRPGWSEGGAVVFFVSGSGTRTAEAFNGSSADAPVLEGEYVVRLALPDRTPPTAPQNLLSPSQTASSISLEWDASTDNEGVAGYEILRDGVLDGTTTSPSYLASGLAAGTFYDFEVSSFDAAGNLSPTSGILRVTTSSSPPATLSVSVASGDDDAEEWMSSGSMKLSSSDLELIEDKSRPQLVGLRFAEVDIPPGSVILSAALQFTVDETDSDATSLEIRGEFADDAAAFSSSASDISSRPTTSAGVTWEPPAWSSAGDAGPDQRSPDLAAVVQEIVDRGGWSSGNAIVMIITGSGKRVAESSEGASGAAPALIVEFQAP